jgi:hypothetical protein
LSLRAGPSGQETPPRQSARQWKQKLKKRPPWPSDLHVTLLQPRSPTWIPYARAQTAARYASGTTPYLELRPSQRLSRYSVWTHRVAAGAAHEPFGDVRPLDRHHRPLPPRAARRCGRVARQLAAGRAATYLRNDRHHLWSLVLHRARVHRLRPAVPVLRQPGRLQRGQAAVHRQAALAELSLDLQTVLHSLTYE